MYSGASILGHRIEGARSGDLDLDLDLPMGTSHVKAKPMGTSHVSTAVQIVLSLVKLSTKVISDREFFSSS